ncbi:MAG: hypothetical protein JO119_02650 [Acidobacteria bacterium]|nr:hypothetical protein [Acidobacteriota bacterium]
MSDRLQALPLALKVTLAVTATVLIGLGSGLIFATHRMANLYGTAESTAGNNAARTAGAAIFALGILAWLAKKCEASMVRNVVIPVIFAWFLLKSVVAYLAFVGGVFKAPVALTVLSFDVTLTAIYAYFLLAKQVEPPQ